VGPPVEEALAEDAPEAAGRTLAAELALATGLALEGLLAAGFELAAEGLAGGALEAGGGLDAAGLALPWPPQAASSIAAAPAIARDFVDMRFMVLLWKVSY